MTLVGPGGVGKTRLALRSATDLRRGIADGVWLVELAGLRDPELVTKAVMTSLGLRDESSQWPVSRLIDYVASKRLLLVLDNCEHLLDACAVLADAVLREAPVAADPRHQQATPRRSQERRSSRSARSRCRTTTEQLAPDRIAQSEAVALLVERAREAGAAFEVTPDNQAAVVELARRLDGIPLAIELAAVRLRTLGLDQIVERLERPFPSARRTEAGPHRRAIRPSKPPSRGVTICLASEEQAVLRRLSVFAGSFSLEAAEQVGQAGADTPADVWTS